MVYEALIYAFGYQFWKLYPFVFVFPSMHEFIHGYVSFVEPDTNRKQNTQQYSWRFSVSFSYFAEDPTHEDVRRLNFAGCIHPKSDLFVHAASCNLSKSPGTIRSGNGLRTIEYSCVFQKSINMRSCARFRQYWTSFCWRLHGLWSPLFVFPCMRDFIHGYVPFVEPDTNRKQNTQQCSWRF